jgi:hypothetical protein
MTTIDTPEHPAEPDYDHLLRANLERVFNERDAAKRTAAVAELYSAEAVMFEPTAIVRGQTAIAKVAGDLLERFGPTFSFTPQGAALGHHGLGTLAWSAGSAGGPVEVIGRDVAEIIEGKIARLWVLFDPPAG